MEDNVSGGTKSCLYIVYWYPSIFHEIFREIDKGKTIEGSNLNKDGFRIKQRFDNYSNDYNDIDDGAAKGLSLRKKEHDNGDLEYWIRKKSDDTVLNFILKYIESNCTGFVIYSYDADLEKKINEFYGGELNDNGIEVIFNLCYHYAKDIYHEHEVQRGSDYRLKPYFKKKGVFISDKPDIYSISNDAIGCFISQYENIFVGYARTLSKSYSLFLEFFSAFQDLLKKRKEERESGWKEILEHWEKLKLQHEEYQYGFSKLREDSTQKKIRSYDEEIEYVSSEEFIENVNEFIEETEKRIKEKFDIDLPYSEENYQNLVAEAKKYISQFSHDLTDLCNNALTEYNYCKTLLESVYNTEFKYSDINAADKPENSNDTEKNRRREVAFNIRNSLRYIEGVRKKCSMWDNLITHNLTQNVEKLIQENNKLTKEAGELIEEGKISNKRSLFLGILSVVLGIISIILSVHGCVSKRTMNCMCNRNTLQQCTDSMASKNDTILHSTVEMANDRKGNETTISKIDTNTRKQPATQPDSVFATKQQSTCAENRIPFL